MATVTRRGTGWYVRVRRKGYLPRFRTLATKREAAEWGVEQEAAGLERNGCFAWVDLGNLQMEGIARAKAALLQGPQAFDGRGRERALHGAGMKPSAIAKELGVGRTSVWRALSA